VTSSRLASNSAISVARSELWSMMRLIQVPNTPEKTSVTTAKTELKNSTSLAGRHSSAQPTTGTRLITTTPSSARRNPSTMKHCGTSTKAASLVSPTMKADGRKSSRATAM
jgi:hypothetical protein